MLEASARAWQGVPFRTLAEGDAVDETQMRHASGVSHGDRLRDTAADTVTDDARFFHIELVEHGDDAIGVRADVHRPAHGTIAAPEAEEIEDDEAMPRRHERNDVAPEMSRRRKTVHEDNGVPGAARTGGVVVDPRAVEIEKLTAHASGRFALGAGR